MTSGPPVPRVTGEVLSVKRVGAYHHLTLVAAGVVERYRPGTFLTLAVGGPHSALLRRRAVAVHRARAAGPFGGTVEVVVDVQGEGTRWLAGLAKGAGVDVVGPLGRPYALPKDPVTCLLVGEGHAAAPLFGLAEQLRDRGCVVHMVLGAQGESRLFGALDARRAARTVVVTTEDGSVGIRGPVGAVLEDSLHRTGAEVVYAAGPAPLLHRVAALAERHGAWSQTALMRPMPCGTGLCHGCPVPVVGEDGVPRTVRCCVEGPVFRGDRVRWNDLVLNGAAR